MPGEHVGATGAAKSEAAAFGDVDGAQIMPRLPRPWVSGSCLSLLAEWEALCSLSQPVNALLEGGLLSRADTLLDEHWVIVRAVVKALGPMRDVLGDVKGWVMLPDALVKIVNLVYVMCDRLSEIDGLVDEFIVPGAKLSSLRQYMAEFLQSHRVLQEDADGSTAVVTVLEGYLLNRLLDDLYPLVRPLIEYSPKQAHKLIALALDPRYCSLAAVVSLNKKLLQGSRLCFEKDFSSGACAPAADDETVRKRVLGVLSRYDNDVIVPMMLALKPAEDGGLLHGGGGVTGVQDGEVGLFAETFDPPEDWKKRQMLCTEISKFRAFKKTILRSGSAEECLGWWESNRELFPNVGSLYRHIVGIPASCVPIERTLDAEMASVKHARRGIGIRGLEDLVFVHENLVEGFDGKGLAGEVGESNVDTLYEIADDLFSS